MIYIRELEKIKTPLPHQGFLGPGHIARAVVQDDFINSDPFIILMDDDLTVPEGDPVGGPHPHAGLETVSLLLEGSIGDDDHVLRAGDLQMMTAGSGIIHTESIEPNTRMRLLQLWLTLPKKDRWATPRVQTIRYENVPQFSSNDLSIRVYSGTLAGVTSPVLNHVPVIIADFQLQPDVTTRQTIPDGYAAFIYVIEGSVDVGEARKPVQQGQAGWLEKPSAPEKRDIMFTGGESGARFVLYAGQPQHEPIISYGPFIVDQKQDIPRLYDDYNAGKMKHVNTLKEPQVVNY